MRRAGRDGIGDGLQIEAAEIEHRDARIPRKDPPGRRGATCPGRECDRARRVPTGQGNLDGWCLEVPGNRTRTKAGVRVSGITAAVSGCAEP